MANVRNWFIPVTLVGMAAFSWAMVCWKHYGNPFMPHLPPRMFTPSSWASNTILSTSKDPAALFPTASIKHSFDPRPFFEFIKAYVFSYPRQHRIVSYVKAFFVGLPFPTWLLLVFIGSFTSKQGRRTALPLIFSAAGGYLLVGGYPKLPGFLSVLLAISVFWILPEQNTRFWESSQPFLKILTGLTLMMGLYGFFYNQSGHRAQSEAWSVLRCLPSQACSGIQRLTHCANLSNDPVIAFSRVENYRRLLTVPPESILLADHEPGALIPSLVGLPLWEVRWYSNTPDERLWKATSIDQCRVVLERLGIQWIQRPGRSHFPLENSFFLTFVDRCQSAYGDLISVEESFR